MNKKMVLISKSREAVSVKLPSFPESEVMMYPWLTTGEQRQILQKYPNLSEKDVNQSADASMDFVVLAIKEWNLASEDPATGKQTVLPINRESLELLPMGDVALLANFISGQAIRGKDGTLKMLSKEEKKAGA